MSNADGMAVMMMMMIGGIVAISASSVAYVLVAAKSQTTAPPDPTTPPPVLSSKSPKPAAPKPQKSVYITTNLARRSAREPQSSVTPKYYLTAGGCFDSAVDLQPKSTAKSQLWKVSVKDDSAYTFSRAAGPCTDLGALHFSSNVQADDPSGKGWASFAMVQSPAALAKLVPRASSRSTVVLRVAGAGYLSAGASVAGSVKLATTANIQEALTFSFSSS